MKPNPDKAITTLENGLKTATDKHDLIFAVGEALGYLRGYRLPACVWDAYRCSFCDVRGVKLWRGVHGGEEKWCSSCGCAQAGLPDDVDDEGRSPTKYGGHLDGKSNQIYSPRKGQNLLPYVPTPDGQTWGYTSVPPEGCHWWRELPTRLEKTEPIIVDSLMDDNV